MGFFKSLFKVVSVVVGAVVGFALGGIVGAVIGAGLGYVGGEIVADLVNSFLNPSYDTGESQLNDGITVNKAGTNNNIPVIYGERTVGGNRAYVATNGDSNKFLYIAFAVSEGEINAFKKIYINDELAWEGTTSHGTRVSSGFKGKFANHIVFEPFHGTSTQTSSALLRETQGWSHSHQGKGIAYIAFRFKWFKIENQEDQDKTPWAGGLPKVTVTLKGKKIADATTFPDSETRSTLYENETTSYNTNNVNALLDYLRNPIYGKNLPNESLNYQSFKDEGTRFNTLDDGSSAPSELKQECNAVIFTEKSVLSNVKAILANMRSAMPFVQGKYKVNLEDNRSNTSRYGSTATSVMTITEDNIIGSVKLESENVKNKYNSIVVSYRGGENNQAIELQVPEAGGGEEATYLSEDNNKINQHRLELNHVTSGSVAKKHAEVLLARSRNRSKVLGFIGDASLNELEINDVFTMEYGSLGINGTFRVRKINFNDNYTFGIVAEEHNDNTYAGNPSVYIARNIVVGRVGEGVPTTFVKVSTGVNIGTFSDLLDDIGPYAGTTDEDGLEAIANGTYTFDSPYDIIYPSIWYAPTPVMTSINVLPSVEGSALERDIVINFNPITEPQVHSVNVYYWHEGEQVWAGLATQSKNPETGKINIIRINASRATRYALKAQANGHITGLSNDISISVSDLTNNSTVYEEY
jgi:hypothetical protein